MRKIREVFRLKYDHDISNRQITVSCNIARSTVAEYLFRFQQAALSWLLPQEIDDNQLEPLLYHPSCQKPRWPLENPPPEEVIYPQRQSKISLQILD